MRRIVVTSMTLMAGLAVVAAPAVAQVGQDVRERPAFAGRGMMGGGLGMMARNPAAAVLDRQDVLGLTAEQVRQIEAIRTRVEQENAPRIDQLRSVFGERGAREMTREERQELRERMQALRPIRDQLRQTNRAAGEEIHGILTDAQEQQLRALRRAERDELRERWRSERRGGDALERRRGDRGERKDVRRPRRGPPGGSR